MQHRRCFLYALAWMLVLSPIAAASHSFADTTLLPYAASDYRYMQFGSETPFPEGIETSSFDESSFGTGQASFGSSADCSDIPAHTTWDPGTKLAVRNHFQAGSSPTGVRLHFGIDNDAVVFINGTQVASVTHEDCAGYDDFVVDVPDGVVVEGDNLIVALCVDRGTIAWFDISVTADDHAPSLTAPLAINGEEGGTLTFDVAASDPDGDSIGALNANLTSLPEGNDATFTPTEDNSAGTFLWHMAAGTQGSYDVTFTAESNDLTTSATTHIKVGLAGTNITGVFTWNTHAGDEGDYDVVFTATDDGGSTNLTTTIHVVSPILAPIPSAPGGSLAPQAPQAPQKGPIISGPTGTSVTAGQTATVSVSASTDNSGALAAHAARRIATASKAVQVATLTVDTSDLPPDNGSTFVVDLQPIVSGMTAVTVLPGVHLSLTYSAADPDGEAIDSFSADLSALPSGNPGAFADNGTHTSGTLTWTPRLADTGTYNVALEAKNRLVGPLNVTITVLDAAAARVFVADPVKFNIGSQRPYNCVFIEPVDASFDLTDVDLSTIRLISPGTGVVTEIAPVPEKTTLLGDQDHNRIPDLQVCFAKADLRALFGLVEKKETVTVELRGQLTAGGIFDGTFQVEVINNGPRAGSASIAPNPLNPQATLSLMLVKGGWLKVTLYDAQGRFVRQLANETNVAPGPRDITVDGKDGRGAPLASGVYYFRAESADGTVQGRLAIVR